MTGVWFIPVSSPESFCVFFFPDLSPGSYSQGVCNHFVWGTQLRLWSALDRTGETDLGVLPLAVHTVADCRADWNWP